MENYSHIAVRTLREELSCCWDGCAVLHDAIVQYRVHGYNALFPSHLLNNTINHIAEN